MQGEVWTTEPALEAGWYWKKLERLDPRGQDVEKPEECYVGERPGHKARRGPRIPSADRLAAAERCVSALKELVDDFTTEPRMDGSVLVTGWKRNAASVQRFTEARSALAAYEAPQKEKQDAR